MFVFFFFVFCVVVFFVCGGVGVFVVFFLWVCCFGLVVFVLFVGVLVCAGCSTTCACLLSALFVVRLVWAWC